MRRTGMGQTAASPIRRAFGLRPHTDPAFIEKMRDVPLLARPDLCAHTSTLQLSHPPGSLYRAWESDPDRMSTLREGDQRRSTDVSDRPSGDGPEPRTTAETMLLPPLVSVTPTRSCPGASR
ncbi:hypothetical protein F6X51_00245 [Methylobacterium planeticum]|uniref:Uncharacterized protein n=1 Tax=Methylobacterium planeticum TaxID=2615211 RepID=A0A6N6N0N9_9HYPH|nr:hypothetical protein F6X51_00245 [Methylobacterium planeticum]